MLRQTGWAAIIGGKLQALDQASGGYPYDARRPQDVHVWTDKADADRYPGRHHQIVPVTIEIQVGSPDETDGGTR